VDLTAADAHLGFVPNGYDPEMRLVFETTALVGTPFQTSAGFDPYQLRSTANNFAVALTVGTVAKNKFTVNFAQAQLSDYVPGNDGPVSTTELVFKPYASTPVANDVLSVVCLGS
jgi:hypothetical protein